MKHYLIVTSAILLALVTTTSRAQELFVYSEPASNMPAKSLGIRLSNTILDESHLNKTTDQFIPELMWGVNKNLMIHAEGFFNNSTATFEYLGAAAYAKYRFYSHDDVHKHFRLAAFARVAYNNGHVHYEELQTNGMNTGYTFGLVGTQLLHKQAIAASLSYEQITDNGGDNRIHDGRAYQGINYTVSTGRLIFPKKYASYRQTNLNVMLELLGQQLPQNGLYYLDIAPSLQIILNSQTRIDLGYRKELWGNMERMTTSSVLIRVEHLLFNVL
jgi:hypothetical protein